MLPTIYGYSTENMKQKIKDIQNLGYTKEEVIKMTKTQPMICGLNIETIYQKFKDIEDLGYTKEEVLKITKTFPTIYSLSSETIKQKIEFYDSIDMHEIAVVDPKQLMQSVSLSYARYKFYEEKNITITMDNYKKLFLDQKSFEKQYSLTKQELLNKYNYEKYMEERNSGRVI